MQRTTAEDISRFSKTVDANGLSFPVFEQGSGPPVSLLPPVACSTLGIWSDRDFALTEDHMRKSYERVTGPWRYEKIEGAGHWMMLEKPAELNRLLLEFLTREPS